MDFGDLVEEVQDISSQLGASFIHIPQKANVLADGLSWEYFGYTFLLMFSNFSLFVCVYV